MTIFDPAPVTSPFDSRGVQIAYDSTSLGWLKTCPQLWKYFMIDGWASKYGSIHLDFGIYYHRAIELYYLARVRDGMDHQQGLRVAVRYMLEVTWNRETGKPWEPEHVKNRWTLLRSVIWYLEEFGLNDNAKSIVLANGKPAVELSFRFAVDDGYWLSGHLDRVVEFGGEVYVMDHKTTGSTISQHYFNGFSPHNQVSLYSVAAKVAYQVPIAGVIIDAAQIAVGFTRFQRGFAARSASVLEEWLDDFQFWAKTAESYVLNNHFPKADTQCDKFGGCPMRDVCRASPVVREHLLKTDFVKRQWNPLEPR